MTQSSEVKIAKITASQQSRQQALAFAEKMVSNPVVELVAWVLFCQYIRSQQQTNVFNVFLTDVEDTALLAAGVGIISCQAIAPAMPMLAQGAAGIGSLIKGIGAIGAVSG